MSTLSVQAVRAARTGILSRVGWVAMTLLALLVALLASRYLFGGPEAYFPQQRAVYIANTAMILAHIGGSILATLISPFQFLKRSRAGRWLSVHRWLGRAYLLGVMSGGAAGLYMSTLAYGGWRIDSVYTM